MRRKEILDAIFAPGGMEIREGLLNRQLAESVLDLMPEAPVTKNIDEFKAIIEEAATRLAAMDIALAVTMMEAARCDALDGGESIDFETAGQIFAESGAVLAAMLKVVQNKVEGPSLAERILKHVAEGMKRETGKKFSSEEIMDAVKYAGRRRSTTKARDIHVSVMTLDDLIRGARAAAEEDDGDAPETPTERTAGATEPTGMTEGTPPSDPPMPGTAGPGDGGSDRQGDEAGRSMN